MSAIPMRVRVDHGKVLTYLVDERAQVGDAVSVPNFFWQERGYQSATIVACESDYTGELVTARWQAT